MGLCAYCRVRLGGDSELCPHHVLSHGEGWHIQNIGYNDLLMRGIEPKRLPESQRWFDADQLGEGDDDEEEPPNLLPPPMPA